MKANEIFNAVDKIAPFDIHWSRDNPGFLVGDRGADINFALVALDITPEVVNEAHLIGAQMIISHHPVIFNPIKNLYNNSPVYLLAKYGISAICAHTNLDCAVGGVNDILIGLCGVEGDTEPLYDAEGLPLGRVGTLPHAMDVHMFALKVKDALTANIVRYADAGKLVKKIGVVGGSAAEDMEIALAMGCDTFVTGDTRYHNMLDAKQLGINLIDAGHFATENPVVKVLRDKLADMCPDVRFDISSVHCDVTLTV